jgi:hypothetical protein
VWIRLSAGKKRARPAHGKDQHEMQISTEVWGGSPLIMLPSVCTTEQINNMQKGREKIEEKTNERKMKAEDVLLKDEA